MSAGAPWAALCCALLRGRLRQPRSCAPTGSAAGVRRRPPACPAPGYKAAFARARRSGERGIAPRQQAARSCARARSRQCTAAGAQRRQPPCPAPDRSPRGCSACPRAETCCGWAGHSWRQPPSRELQTQKGSPQAPFLQAEQLQPLAQAQRSAGGAERRSPSSPRQAGSGAPGRLHLAELLLPGAPAVDSRLRTCFVSPLPVRHQQATPELQAGRSCECC